jgi:hypothetical protein
LVILQEAAVGNLMLVKYHISVKETAVRDTSPCKHSSALPSINSPQHIKMSTLKHISDYQKSIPTEEKNVFKSYKNQTVLSSGT